VAVEDHHKTLKNKPESRSRDNLKSFSESYDCEPDKFSISCDPGERIIPLSDSQRCSIVRKGHYRPELSDQETPKDKKQDILVTFTTA
jgi:hypothetical protein